MNIRRIAYALRPMTVVVLLWTLARVSGLELALLTPAGLVALVAMVAALVVEFALSKDIGAVSFCRDILFASVNLVLATALITTLAWWDARTVNGTDILLACCVLVDGWVGATNSYATALRNWSGSVSQGGSHQGEA